MGAQVVALHTIVTSFVPPVMVNRLHGAVLGWVQQHLCPWGTQGLRGHPWGPGCWE